MAGLCQNVWWRGGQVGPKGAVECWRGRVCPSHPPGGAPLVSEGCHAFIIECGAVIGRPCRVDFSTMCQKHHTPPASLGQRCRHKLLFSWLRRLDNAPKWCPFDKKKCGSTCFSFSNRLSPVYLPMFTTTFWKKPVIKGEDCKNPLGQAGKVSWLARVVGM